jgi:hypothetical protein
MPVDVLDSSFEALDGVTRITCSSLCAQSEGFVPWTQTKWTYHHPIQAHRKMIDAVAAANRTEEVAVTGVSSWRYSYRIHF